MVNTRYIVYVLAVLCTAFTAFSQDVQPGVYQFETVTAPQVNISGTWFVSGDVLLSSVSGSYVEFAVSDNVQYVEIELQQNTSGTYGNYNICASACTGSSRQSLAVNVSGTVTIAKTDNEESRFDYFKAVQSVPTPVPTPTPNPAITYSSISGISGTYGTEFHMTVTAGDVAISSALIFLLFSLWVGGLVYMIFGGWNG